MYTESKLNNDTFHMDSVYACAACCVCTHLLPPMFHPPTMDACRARRTVENKLFAGDERLEDVETELRAAKQAAQEWEARYEEVCLSPWSLLYPCCLFQIYII